jgi:hypothetical protein
MTHDDLTPEEEQVRRLLADARHREPMPEDVAARLDDVLSGLQEHPAPVVRTSPSGADLDAARRRRRVRSWVLAAAAVVVLGVGFNQVDWTGPSGGDSTSSDSVADSAAGAEAPAESSEEDRDLRTAVRRLSSERFGEEVELLRATRATLSSDQAPLAASRPDGLDVFQDGKAEYSVVCDLGRLGLGRAVPVRYDGERGWLVFRVPEGDTQVVDLYLCGRDEPTRSVTLPVP